VIATRVTERIEAAFEEAHVRGFFHARDLATGRTIGVAENAPVCLASVFKISVLAELYRKIGAGELEATRRMQIPAETRTVGPTGLSVMKDAVDISLRDLAFWMMCVSDNTATDVICELITLDAINANLRRLGLTETLIGDDCKRLLKTYRDYSGMTDEDLKAGKKSTPEKMRTNPALQPTTTVRSTPAETTRLLELIWKDEAATPEACAEMRRIMYLQVWPHRLSSAFDEGIKIGAKTGTLTGIRNEAGVVEYPDGGKYAVAVFTRQRQLFEDTPPRHSLIHREADAVIGRAARIAVDNLRGEEGGK
jgi:beta-lactamase class A